MARVRPTMADIRAELAREGVLEGSINVKTPRVHVAGYCDSETEIVSIDPYVPCCQAVLHEMIHRRHKRLSEARVKEETARLMQNMTTYRVKQFCERYQRHRRKTNHTIVVDHVD